MITGLLEKLGLAGDRSDLSPQVQMSIALARRRREGEIYAGTVSYPEKRRRRAANRRARAARRVTRQRAR